MTDKLKKAALKKGNEELAKEVEEIGGIVFKLMDIVTNDKIRAETRLRALSEVMDRTDGKPIQRNEITGKDGEPIETSPIVVQFTSDKITENKPKEEKTPKN